MVGVQGSALNKWTKGDETRRDMFTANPTSAPVDMSDGKGIYNLTIKTDEDLDLNQSDSDMGEEVYGCIVSGYTKNLNAPKIEYSAQEAIDNRRERKTYPKGKDHFSEVGRIWATNGLGCIDSVCVPTENIPLVANSKFAIKYWEEGETAKMIEIPKGAGFTSGTLVRPVAFTDKVGEIKNGSMKNDNFLRSYTLKAVPIKTAHAILNRCKEISLTGSVDYSVERTNKKCSGVETSKSEIELEGLSGHCPPGYCVDLGSITTLSCASTKLTTKITMAGSIDMTARRHKQVADIWDSPKALDISGNYFHASPSGKGTYMKVSNTSCEEISDSIATPIPIPQVQQIAKGEEQIKLTSGCLTYPITNSAMLHATLEENLKTKVVSIANCSSAETYYNLMSDYLPSQQYLQKSNSEYAGGVRQSGSPIIRPEFASGPSLSALFNNAGWDFSGVGASGPEDAYSKDCKAGETTNFYNYKGKWNSTGITMTVEGECPQNMIGLDRYDTSTAVAGCKCGDACGDCKKNYGKLGSICECMPRCTPYPNTNNPCNGQGKAGCDCIYTVFMEIGKYVGVEIDPEFQYYNTAAVPLSTKMNTKDQDEDLVLWWAGELAQIDPDNATPSRSLTFYLSQETANKAKPQDDSTTKWEVKEVGALTIKCDDWSTGAPLWTLYGIAKATTCKGKAGPYNEYSTSKLAGTSGCVNCDEDSSVSGVYAPDCCSATGCGGPGGESDGCCNSESCGIDDPCGYAVIATIKGGGCKQMDCGGECHDTDNYECGCCFCEKDGDGEQCDICPPSATCKPYQVISDYEERGCYGDAHEEDKHEASISLTLEFKLFTEME